MLYLAGKKKTNPNLLEDHLMAIWRSVRPICFGNKQAYSNFDGFACKLSEEKLNTEVRSFQSRN